MLYSPENLPRVPGEGGDGPVDEVTLRAIKAAAETWAERAERFWAESLAAAQTRFCTWAGQSPDGRLRREFIDGDPEPFDGASDQRIRWADGYIKEIIRLIIVSVNRAQIRVEPRGKDDAPQAQYLSALLRWIVDHLGGEWTRQLQVLLNYMLQDSPAVACMQVDWDRHVELEMQRVTIDELHERYMQQQVAEQQAGEQQAGESPDVPPQAAAIEEAWGRFVDAMQQSAPDEDLLAQMLIEFFPEIRLRRARRAAQQLRRGGFAEWPVPRLTSEGPRLRALRFGQDFVIPDNATDFQRASPWFVHEWLTEAELRGRVTTDGWNGEWVDQAVTRDGDPVWPNYSVDGQGFVSRLDPDKFKGRVEVLWAYFIALNEDDLPARYACVIRPDIEGTAFGRRMLRDRHGGWPAVFFQREILDAYLLNARGIPELLGPTQGITKMLQDVETDAANIGGLPPVISNDYENKGDIYLEPLKHFPLRRDGQLRFMQPPAFPAAIETTLKRLTMQRDEFFGRANPDLKNDQQAAIATEFMVADVFAGITQILRMMLSLAQQYGSPQLFERVTSDVPRPPPESNELQGEYDVRLVFRPGDLDIGELTERMQALRDVLLAIDRDRTIDTTPIVQYAFRALFPQVAEDALRPVDRAQADEITDEVKNYQKLRAGVMPTINTEGTWNYGIRLELYDRLIEANPSVFDDMAPDKRQNLDQWIKALQHQNQQFGENVNTGRAGAAIGTATEGDAAPEAPAE